MKTAERFMQLFDGLRRAHGEYRVEGKEGNKHVGRAKTVVETVTTVTWKRHLDGTTGLGVVPITDESTCKFGAIDIDKYDGLDYVEVIRKSRKKGLPFVPCRSKSGGLHLFLFSKEQVRAREMRAALRAAAAAAGFGDAEIFPKQAQVMAARGDVGSWINMPYFDAARTTRYGLNDDGSPMSVEEFLAKAESSLVDLGSVDLGLSSGDFADGPPCLQHLASMKVGQGARNEALLNMAKYFKRAVPDEWLKFSHEANEKYIDPALPRGEVDAILKSVNSKNYWYGCNKPPLKPYCDRGTCRLRKHGAGSSGDFPLLTTLSKYDTNPPTWFVDVEGINGDDAGGRMELTTEELQNQLRFQRRCMECLNVMPPVLKVDQWQTMVQSLLKKVAVIPVPADASATGQFLDLLEEFCTSRAQAKSREEILIGKPWLDGGRHYFRMSDLTAFLERRRFKELKVHKIAQIIKHRDGEHRAMNIHGRCVNVWSVPEYTRRDDRPLASPRFEEDAKV